jgi:hypothetical protein
LKKAFIFLLAITMAIGFAIPLGAGPPDLAAIPTVSTYASFSSAPGSALYVAPTPAPILTIGEIVGSALSVIAVVLSLFTLAYLMRGALTPDISLSTVSYDPRDRLQALARDQTSIR